MHKYSGLLSFLLLLILQISQPSQASLITYNGYTLDTDTNVVTGCNVEWLQWNQTLGQSINSALSQYGAEGWSVATNEHMTCLYSALFPTEDWSTAIADEGNLINPVNVKAFNHFTELMGITLPAFGGLTASIYGSDENNNGRYKTAEADYNDLVPYAKLSNDDDAFTAEFSEDIFGVALTRKPSTSTPHQQVVPEPNSLILLIFGLVLLLLLERERTKLF